VRTRTLVIVESPTMAATIQDYLGEDFTVLCAFSRDGARDHVAALKSAATVANYLLVALPPEWTSETLALDVAARLGENAESVKRATFAEITREAVIEAISSPRRIDMRLVDAAETRRAVATSVASRIARAGASTPGVKFPTSAHQSVAVRLIVERERGIEAFLPVAYWSVDVRLSPEGDQHPFVARLNEVPDGKLAASPDRKGIVLGREADASTHAKRLRTASYRVRDVERKERKRSPAPPFTTSTLQQEAARKLGFTARKTMTLAQRLYAGIDLPDEGSVGLITYMRTDSVTIADTTLREISELVKSEYGTSYMLGEPRRFKTHSHNAQEAHEAIRPTSAMRTPQRVAASLERDQLRLYTLIWLRTVATQMADARFNQVGVSIDAAAATGERYGLLATGQTLIFDGFLRLYREGRDDDRDEDAESVLPELTAERMLRMLEVLPEGHFTQPPPRFTEASLVKQLEELGIGRPSTYASIISTIQDSGYVRLEDKRFRPEDVGMIVTDKLLERFPDVVDVHFTARLEEDLDDIAEGKLGKVQMLEELDGVLSRALGETETSFEGHVKGFDEECPLCPKEGRDPSRLAVKRGRYGRFIGCMSYPECRYVRNMDGTERAVPNLQGDLPRKAGMPEGWELRKLIDRRAAVAPAKRRRVFRRAAARCDEAATGRVTVLCETHGVVSRIDVSEMAPELADQGVEDQRRFMLARLAHTAALVESAIDGSHVSALLDGDPSRSIDALFNDSSSWLDGRLMPGLALRPSRMDHQALEWWSEHRGWLRVTCGMHGDIATVDASRDPRMLGVAWDAAVIEQHARWQSNWLHSSDEPEFEGGDCRPRIVPAADPDEHDLLEVVRMGHVLEGPWPWWTSVFVTQL
jgi:DNA topoisomerase I